MSTGKTRRESYIRLKGEAGAGSEEKEGHREGFGDCHLQFPC